MDAGYPERDQATPVRILLLRLICINRTHYILVQRGNVDPRNKPAASFKLLRGWADCRLGQDIPFARSAAQHSTIIPTRSPMVPRRIESRMWAEACRMLRQAEQLRHRLFEPRWTLASSPVWEPSVDALKTETDHLVTVALPGVEVADIGMAADPPSVIEECRRRHRSDQAFGRFTAWKSLTDDLNDASICHQKILRFVSTNLRAAASG